MKLCRFDNNRLGIVEGGEVLDVTRALSVIPEQRWPIAQGDPLIANLKRVLAAARKLAHAPTSRGASASGACSSRRIPRLSASVRRSSCAGPTGATTTRWSSRS